MTVADWISGENREMALLEQRLGRSFLQRRLEREQRRESRGVRGASPFEIDRWGEVIRKGLQLTGLYERGRRNALAIELRHHRVAIPGLPAAFAGATMLQLSDLHLDINEVFVDALIERVRPLTYDFCVLTGDYRARTFGPFEAALAGLERLRAVLSGRIYAVLGNHDSIRMVPPMEAMGFTLLIDECATIERDGEEIRLAGIDDAHGDPTESISRVASGTSDRSLSILLSHRPSVYRHAARASFSLMLSGHIHGGQICLPGGIPVVTDRKSPRALAVGPWQYQNLRGYTSAGAGTSIVDVRFNCPPEITLHRFERTEG